MSTGRGAEEAKAVIMWLLDHEDGLTRADLFARMDLMTDAEVGRALDWWAIESEHWTPGR